MKLNGQPVIANALERAQIGKFHSENIFNLVSSQVPVDIAVEMADKNVSTDMRTSADILEKLRQLQTKFDNQDDKRTDLELEQKEADIEQTEAQTKATKEQVAMQKTMVSTGGTVGGAKKHGESEEEKSTRGKSPAEEQREKAESDKTKSNYSRLEQKQKEKTIYLSAKDKQRIIDHTNNGKQY